MLNPISEHAANIHQVLLENYGSSSWDNSCDWLHIASSIKCIQLSTIQYNPGFGWCSHSDQYNISRQELLEATVKQLSIFNFAWGALESIIDYIAPPKTSHRSEKVKDTCIYIEANFSTHKEIMHLECVTKDFRLSASNCLGLEKVNRRFNLSQPLTGLSTGLYTVYGLRNLFAHGSFIFPEPDEDILPISEHSKMISHATRIVLLSIQMLLLAHYRKPQDIVHFNWNTSGNYFEGTLETALLKCHLSEQNVHNTQLGLF